MQIDITQVVVMFFTLISAVVTYIVISWINSKIGSAQWDHVCRWAIILLG